VHLVGYITRIYSWCCYVRKELDVQQHFFIRYSFQTNNSCSVVFGATDPLPPPQAPVGQGLLIHGVSRSYSKHHTRLDSSGRVISSSQIPLSENTQKTHNRQTSTPPGGIGTHNLNMRAAADPRLDRAATGTGSPTITMAYRKVNIKLKFTLRTGHEGPQVGVEVCHYSFFNSGVRWGGWSTPSSIRFIQEKDTRYPLYRRLGGPQGRSGRVRKISPTTGIRSPNRPARNESLYRLSYPGPQ